MNNHFNKCMNYHLLEKVKILNKLSNDFFYTRSLSFLLKQKVYIHILFTGYFNKLYKKINDIGPMPLFINLSSLRLLQPPIISFHHMLHILDIHSDLMEMLAEVYRTVHIQPY